VNEFRRSVLAAAAAAGVHALIPLHASQKPMNTTVNPVLDPVPAVPSKPTPGKPGDFKFLDGEWRIKHFWRATPKDEWISFEGEATCWSIMGGVGSVEELRIPVRDFHGMGLRLLDLEKRVWSDYWVNAKSGALGRDGQTGSFEGGAGIFIGNDTQDGKPIKAGGVWDQITANSCRWRQVVSNDDGKTWAHTWVMHWKKV
jgi:hypothetical protein